MDIKFFIDGRVTIDGEEYKKVKESKVKEDILMVECIDNEGIEDNFELGEAYKVEKEDSNVYFIRVDSGIFSVIKSRFKPVSKEQQKEYTLQEVFEGKEGTKFKVTYKNRTKASENIIIKIEEKYKEYKQLYWSDGEEVRMIEPLMNAKFTKVEELKPVSTVEAFKALEEGKTIESVETLNKYRKHLISKELLVKSRESKIFGAIGSIYFIELENQWLIIE